MSTKPKTPTAQEPAAWNGPGEMPHEYSPDYMAMGDCHICGHTYEAHFEPPSLLKWRN